MKKLTEEDLQDLNGGAMSAGCVTGLAIASASVLVMAISVAAGGPAGALIAGGLLSEAGFVKAAWDCG